MSPMFLSSSIRRALDDHGDVLPLELPGFESFLLEKLSETKLPGVSIAIVRKGEVAYSKGFGLRDIASGLPATPTTLYGIASITKSFTAVAISQLVDECKLEFLDPVTKYVPLSMTSFQNVTLHHLLTHSSGMPALAYLEAYVSGVTGLDESAWLPTSTPEGIASFMADSDDWREAEPGERFFYLNEGYALLGAVISSVTGQPYEEYITKKILEPLRMKRTFFTRRDVDAETDRATPYIIHDGKQTATIFPYGLTSDAGLVSNALDLSNYVIMYLGRGIFEGKEIISRRSLEEMERAHMTIPHSLLGGEAYGYGLSIAPDFYGQRLVFHGGSVYVHTGFIGYLPEAQAGIAVLANGSGYRPSDLGMYGLASLMGKDVSLLPFVRNAGIMRSVEGHYKTYKGTKRAEITQRGDFLNMRISDRFPGEDVTLVPGTLTEDTATFYTFIGSRRYDAEFRLDRGSVELIFERYKFRKTN